MPQQSWTTDSPEQTVELGRQLAAQLGRPRVILLIGNLGAGKTTLVKGLVDGYLAGGADEVSSPTFALIHDYGQHIFHLDLYRLETEAEAARLGLEELFDIEDAVVLIEWGERFPNLFPGKRTEITIRREDERRRIELTD